MPRDDAAQTAFFDAHAAVWEERCYPPETRIRLAALVDGFGLRPGMRVLDMGTGPGTLVPYLAERIGPEGRITAVDLSGAMCREARRKRPRCEYEVLQASAAALPLPAAVMDKVICFACFPHFSDKLGALREMARTLVPGGELIVAHLMDREELARHHGGKDAVKDDLLPSDDVMVRLFEEAGLTRPVIDERPGRYVARAVRRQEMIDAML